MKYLVTGEYIDPGALMPPQQVADIIEHRLIPSLEALAKMESEKKILAGGVGAGMRIGWFIVEAASNDEVSRLVQGLPFWGLLKWDVTPVQTFADRAAQDKKHLADFKAALK